MIYRKTFLVIAILAVVCNIYGQNDAINWINGGEVTSGTIPLKVAEQDEKGFCILNARLQGFMQVEVKPPILERFTYPDCNRIYSVNLDNDARGKEVNLDYVTLLSLKNNMVILRKDDKLVYAQQLNRETGEIEDNKVIVGNLPVKEYKHLPFSSGMYAVSGDGSTFITSYMDTADKKITVTAFGADLQQKWTKVLSRPFGDNWFYPMELRLSYDGNTVYWMVLQYFDKLLTKDSHEFAFDIMAYYHSNDVISTYDLNLNDKWVSSFAMNVDKAGNLVCAGFYSVFKSVDDGFEVKTALLGAIPATLSSSAGSFMMRIDFALRQVTVNKTTPFDKSYLLHFMTEKEIADGTQVNHLLADTLIEMADHSFVMCGETRTGSENLYSTVHYDPNINHFNSSPAFNNGLPGNTYVTYNREVSFFYGDAIVLKFSPDGTVSFIKNIAKRQSTDFESRYCSFAFFIKDDFAYMVYNDDKKNLQLAPDVVAKERDDAINRAVIKVKLIPDNVMVLAKIDMASGTVNRTCLTDKKDNYSMLFSPGLVLQYSPNEFLMFHDNRKKYEFGIVKF